MENSPQYLFATSLKRGDVEGVRLALKQGANPDLGPRGEQTYYPLNRLLDNLLGSKFQQNFLSILDLMLDHGANPLHVPQVCSIGPFSHFLFHFVLSQEQENVPNAVPAIEMLIDKWNASVDWRTIEDDWGVSLLARYTIAPDLLRTLLRNGLDPNTRSADGTTALMTALKNSKTNVKSIELLLEYGANPYLQEHTGKTAMLWALGTKEKAAKLDCIEAMLRHGYDILLDPALYKIKPKLKRVALPQGVSQSREIDALRSRLVHDRLSKKAERIRSELRVQSTAPKPKI